MLHAYRYSTLAVMILDAVLLYWGFAWLDLPPAYKLIRLHHPLLAYWGYILVMVAVMLAWFHDYVPEGLLWVCRSIHRLLSSLLIMGIVGIEMVLHLLNVPHLEGWWLPIFSGSAAFTGVLAWIHKLRKKS